MTWPTIDFLSMLLAAALGSFHCAGMCGGLVLAASAGRGLLATQLAYHVAKSTVYVGVGAAAGLLGRNVVAAGSSWGASRGLAIAAGVIMLIIGLHGAGLFSRVGGAPARFASAVAELVRPFMAGATRYRGRMRAVVLGTLSALLPCPLVYAFAAKAVATGSIVAGAATMAALGLGTIPMLVAVAASERMIPARVRIRLVRASGWLVAALGVVMILRGFQIMPCCGDHSGALAGRSMVTEVPSSPFDSTLMAPP